jgi:hypothetical protein
MLGTSQENFIKFDPVVSEKMFVKNVTTDVLMHGLTEGQ